MSYLNRDTDRARIVRSLVDGCGMAVATARTQVADRLDTDEASRFEVDEA